MGEGLHPYPSIPATSLQLRSPEVTLGVIRSETGPARVQHCLQCVQVRGPHHKIMKFSKVT